MGQAEIPQELAGALRSAHAVAALTGSGVSAESGVPTFRDAQTGLWERFDPQELATPEAFSRDPKLVWEWYSWRRGLVARAEPNPAHRTLAELERRVPRFTLITQNVDGLHRRAGSENVIELHGNILRTVCSAERIPREPGEGSPPRCPHCGAPLRPDVVWFGEALPPGALEEASEAARGCELFLCVGTSGLVYPAAGLPREASEAGALLVEINPERTPLTPLADFVLCGRAGEVLPALFTAAFPGG
ncbi:NAD-dependent protein deacylase [Rubrobacter xylanophilus]|uniref:NAD-dependent protein deacylase n=1 Tax=Rubrobacter xylanophilus TaxID=49319 RepID=A0A510HHR7_9ACTN|nr:NAD-dependent deacylase [Rubrobacter xylanophilus]BBL78805.1 NAD-dependent protein deacylase [Rubrobacter xylanophilus]